MRLGQVTIPTGWGRVLDFDIESRPLGWYGGEYVHQEVTVIAAAWVDDPDTMYSWHLEPGGNHVRSMKRMLNGFRELYDEAGMVTGHYIRGFDLPQIQAALIEYDLPLLGEKLTQDTKSDLIKFQGLSKSQQNLGGLFGTEAPKIGMHMHEWREGNRLQKSGIELVVERCEGDVRQHIQMRERMLEAGVLMAPKIWEPGHGKATAYTP